MINRVSILTLIFTIILIQAAPVLATGMGTIAITSPASPSVNGNYNVDLYFSDMSGPLAGQTIDLSVTSPDGASTIQSPVVTDGAGHATALLHTSLKAGYNNITAESGSASSSASLWISPGAINSLSVKPDYAFAIADGYQTVSVKAVVADVYGNPIKDVPVDMSVDGIPIGSMITDASGAVSTVVGPFTGPEVVDVTADASGINYSASTLASNVTFLLKNNLFLLRYPGATAQVDSNAKVVAVWYYDLAGNVPAVGVPLKIAAYAPDNSYLGEYTGITDANGTVSFSFIMSPMAGFNNVIVSNSALSNQPLKSTSIEGILSDATRLTLASIPSSPIYADGQTGYTFQIRALDNDGKPVKYKYVTVVKNGDVDNSVGVLTNNNGYAWVDIGASHYVQDVTIEASTQALNNSTITNSTILRYVAGPPSSIKAFANPYVVASSDVLTPPGMTDVHQTDITTIITDSWGHPISGQQVAISSLDTALGDISGPSLGYTTASGEFTTQFKLNNGVYGEDLTIGVPIRVTSGSLSDTCYIYYTNRSFLSVKSSIEPNNNLSVNDTINVTITVRGIGWKIRPQNSSISLIFDSSGSMDWMSSIIYPYDLKPESGYMQPWQYTNWSDHNVDPRDWHYIDTYDYEGDGAIQIMLSSNYRNYSWYGSYYYLKVIDPDNNTFSTDNTYSSNVQNSQNENIIKFNNAQKGLYRIYGSYAYNAAMGNVPYNMMVLTQPKRLGQASDQNSAAKVAANGFVDNMTNSQIGVVWFNVSSGIPQHLTIDDSVNRSIIKSSINSLAASGGTNIYLGLDRAISDFSSPYYIDGNRKFIILLSDGYSQTPDMDLASARTAAQQNITIYTIGMGMPDDLNLGEIANITGGNYSRVYTDAQLNDVYSSISRDLREVVANYTEMHLLSNCTNVNNTWTPDVQYIPGSGILHYPNGTVINMDPDPYPYIDSNNSYNIVWNPGTIKLNDTWSVTYSLKVLKDGNVTPIRNDSYIYFIRDDGSYDTLWFSSQTLFVNGNSNKTMMQPGSRLSVNITSPLPKTGSELNSVYQPIEWTVNYTGNGTYHQKIYMIQKDGSQQIIGYSDDGNYSGNYRYMLNAGQLSIGNYTVMVYADDGIYADDDTVVIIVPDNRGQIILI